MMSITVEDYETQYWPKLEHAIQHLLTTKPSDYIPISYEQMYTYVASVYSIHLSLQLIACQISGNASSVLKHFLPRPVSTDIKHILSQLVIICTQT